MDAGVIAGCVVAGMFGLLALSGESLQSWARERRLRKHTCHTSCTESRWCACGCRDGMYGRGTGTRCAVCGTQYATRRERGTQSGVEDDEEFQGPWSSGDHVNFRPSVSDITQENPVPRGFTSWGWERDREFRRARWEDKGGRDGQGDGDGTE